ncbi:MAG: hypothetical protein CL872_00215 [Dehalococcoidaceae bacterium]|nr:hypothetical protein [Dehalococcoidaceae bacterium]|tara:strand:- start:13469 stop:13855 length:387 start_codon:yes stop_codon:yes gene_type:complete
MTTKLLDSSDNELSIKTINDYGISTFLIYYDNNTKKHSAKFSTRLSKQSNKAFIRKIYFSSDYDWSLFGINGVLKIESMLMKLKVKNIVIQASLLDGLEVYFWTRCGYKPILNNKNKKYFLMQKVLLS